MMVDARVKELYYSDLSQRNFIVVLSRTVCIPTISLDKRGYALNSKYP